MRAIIGSGRIKPNQKFGSLIAIRESKNHYYKPGGKIYCKVVCICTYNDCNRIKRIRYDALISGRTQTCGRHSTPPTSRSIKHGMCGTLTYSSWKNAISRSVNKNNKDYDNYGGAGKTMCEHYRNFELFFKDLGERPENKNSLDRIDGDDGYHCGKCDECKKCKLCKKRKFKTNCRWANVAEQVDNRSITRRVIWNGKEMTIRQLSKKSAKYGVRCDTLFHRINNGWPIKEAVTTPVWGRRK